MGTALATVGNVNVDLIMGPVTPWPKTGSEVICPNNELRVGGAAGNVALAWQAMGLDFQCAANTGSDHFGDWLRSNFGTIAAGWPRCSENTTVSVGVTHPDDERTFLTTTGHLPKLGWSEVDAQIDWEHLRGGTLVLCGSFLTERLSAEYDHLFDRADRADVTVALDTGWPIAGWTQEVRERALNWVARSGIVLLNAVEATCLTDTNTPEQALVALSDLLKSDGVAVIKLGPEGAIARKNGQTFRASAPKVPVKDTIGAGDVFNAAFSAALSQGSILQKALEQAVATASLAISSSPRRYIPEEVTV